MKIESRRAAGLVRVSRNGKRFFSAEHKRAVVEKCLVPGASVSAAEIGAEPRSWRHSLKKPPDWTR